jgi:hypothetical protein
MKRTLWIAAMVACAVWAGCGDDSSSDGGDNVQPVTINGAIVVPASWAGTWQITLTFRNCVTNDILSQEVVTAQVCPGDTLVNPFGPVFEQCTGSRTGNHLEASCESSTSNGACQVTADLDFTMDVNGNQLTGSGTINLTATPGCASTALATDCQRIGIAGTRLSSSTAGCDTLNATYRPFLK